MTIHAKEIIDGRFWIIENKGIKIATLALSDNKFLLSDRKGTRFYNSKNSVEKDIGNEIIWDSLEITETNANEIYNYPTSVKPYNHIYDVQKKLPLFTKSIKSKSLYCAGYFIINFEKGWVKSFCPKLITVEKYEYEGPFKTKIEMKTALGKKNASRTN